MTKHLTDLSERLADLVEKYPDGIPADLVDLERRRVIELAHMVGEGLVD
jgi:hypothetical protein